MTRFLFAALLLTSSLHAQFDTATVLGAIKDQTGNGIPSAKVVLSNVADGTQQTTITDSQGDYQFLNVRIAEYTLKAEATGFKAATAEKFTVTVNARQRVDLILAVGDVTETVTVEGAAAVLETDSSDRGQVIATRQILDLPLNGRSYADLTLLSPGVRKSVLENGTVSSRDASYNVNGQRSAFNNFILDGVDNNAYGTSNQGFSNQVVQITPDAVAEYRVATDNYSAEYGRASGAVINASVRSGTNSYHGSAWEFLRNTDLNAVGFFQPTLGVKPVFQQNQFGAAGGGRIIKDKLFFFVDYEGLRRVQRTLTFAAIPTASFRAGRFTQALNGQTVPIPIRNPYTGEVYSDGVVPSAQVSAFAKAVLAALPDANFGTVDGANTYESLPRASINDDKGDWKIDFIPNQKVTNFVRYSQREANLFVPGNIPGPAGGNDNGNVHMFQQAIVGGTTWMLSPTSTLEGRVGVSWFDGGKFPIGVGEPSLLTSNGIGGLPTDPTIAGALNSQSVRGYSQFGRQGSNPQFQNPFVVNPKVNYSKYLGRHTLKAGFEHQNITTTIDDFNPVYGQDTYSGAFSQPTGGSTTSVANAAYGLADFMFGARSNYQLNNFVIIDLRQYMNFAYLQDDFKVSSKLTLNLGIRYEFATPQWVADNRLANFDPATRSLIQAKSGSLYDRSLVNPRYNDWAPRLGFAYRVAPKTVLRGGYGISWIHFNRMGGENLLAYNGPNIVNASFDQSPANLPLCTNVSDANGTCFRPTQLGYPANFAVPANFNSLLAAARYIPKDNPDGYVQSWHFNVQQEITPSLVVDVAYVGSHGVHLMILGDQNQAAPQVVGQNLSLQARRPISNFQAIEVAFGAGFSNYHALQFKVEKRYSGGLYVLNSFTWSKAIDNASGHLEANNGDNSRVNIANLKDEKGLSGYDQPVNNTTAIVYDLPFGRGRKFLNSASRLTDGILGGWQLSVINTATSGLPVNLSYSPASQYQVSGYPTYRPNIIGDPRTPNGGATNYLNKANVISPITTTNYYPFGNAGRNIVRGPGLIQPDIAMHKQFRLYRESDKLEFRAEMFNVINRTNLGSPDGNVSNGTFGTITTLAGPARQVQFALKLYY
jgi:hypothetical protein